MTEKDKATYERVKRFINNELHVNLLCYQEQLLQFYLDTEIQDKISSLYQKEDKI